MNGAVYISFFQGQLESVLEQVVQLAVQEISKSVGSSLNALLLETAAKEQENRRLRTQLQTREGREGRGSTSPEDGGSAAVGRSRSPACPGAPDRAQQRERADQLKSVMEQVLAFALRELTKIVEASFDDLLLEITKMEKEQQTLEEKLGRSSERGGAEKGRGGRRRGSVNDSVSPSGSEDTREEPAEESKQTPPAEGEWSRPPDRPAPQDWVPILDKVFGQKWCSEVWPMKGEGGDGCGDGRSLSEGGARHGDLVSSVILQPSPSSPQQDPRWTPLEDMEVFSPDDQDAADNCRSSASMLHRLLTLPSQLLGDDDDAEAKETLMAMATNGGSEQRDDGEPPDRVRPEEDEEDEEEGDKGRKTKRRRVWSECEECGRRFSRMSLLKAHRQTHAGDAGACGKRFSSNTRLHSHVRTQHPENRS
uniref:Uncharacterized LOC105921638 n=1 Tax=Fundulus heteroclitus TaxID=8078 RepID=A0A3Q2QUN2_FUNHE